MWGVKKTNSFGTVEELKNQIANKIATDNAPTADLIFLAKNERIATNNKIRTISKSKPWTDSSDLSCNESAYPNKP